MKTGRDKSALHLRFARFLSLTLTALTASSVLTGCPKSSTNSSDAPSSVSTGVKRISFATLVSTPVILKGGSSTMMTWPVVSNQPLIVSTLSSSDGGTTWTTLEPYLANTGFYAFNAPSVDSSNYKIKVVGDGTDVAISDTFRIVSTPPSLNPDHFASNTAISSTEFFAYASFSSGTPPNPQYSGYTWALDLSTLVTSRIGFTAVAPVSTSQRGGGISCNAMVCTYNGPSSSTANNATLDTFMIYLVDPIGNQSSYITIALDPTYNPGSGNGSGGSESGNEGGIPTLIPLASVTDGGFSADPRTYCPSSGTTSGGSIWRVCNSGDISTACTGPQVLKPTSGQTYASWSSALQAFVSGIPDGATLEFVYDSNSGHSTFDPSNSLNHFTTCDLNITQTALTIQGVCGLPVLTYSSYCPKNLSNSSKGIITNVGHSNRYVHLEFTKNFNGPGSGCNAAGIKDNGWNSVIAYSYFHDGQNGVLGGGFNDTPDGTGSTILIENSKFEREGHMPGACATNEFKGLAHGVYLSHARHAVIKNSIFVRSQMGGHEAKSRAEQTTILCSVFSSQSSNGSPSSDSNADNWPSVALGGHDNSLLDIPEGGRANIQYSVFGKGSNPSNHAGLISYAEETVIDYPHRLRYHQDFTFDSNVVYNRLANNVFFLNYHYNSVSSNSVETSLTITNNTIIGLGNSYSPNLFFHDYHPIVDLSFDLSLGQFGNLLTNNVGVLNSAAPGTPNAEYLPTPDPAHCPDFQWQPY